MSGWCRTALARLVFPIPPAPKIAILGVSCVKALRIVFISDSRPWNIFGSDGNIDNELELEIMSSEHGIVLRSDLPVLQAR
jgi:hypothetical protein